MKSIEMIEEIKKTANCIKTGNTAVYIIKKDKDIPVQIKFISTDYCKVKDTAKSMLLWEVNTIEDFYNIYMIHINNFLEYQEVSSRNYGQPKLKKPKELKGIKPIFSIGYRKKHQIFKNNNDIWIKNNDINVEEIEMPK